MTNWFELLTGFTETLEDVRTQLEVVGTELRSKANGRAYGIGTFEMASLAELRARVAAGTGVFGAPRVSIVQGDVGEMHRAIEYGGAVFQVASQFNALEMPSPSITPEHGVTGYAHDQTQGPACAMAAGAATIYRNYFVPVEDGVGQSVRHQLDGLVDIGHELSRALGRPVPQLWDWRNGYALCTREGLELITNHLGRIDRQGADALAGLLRIGLHLDVEVTAGGAPGQFVSQAFCSALPVAYGNVSQVLWADFAKLVLDAAYEATLLQGVLNARRGTSKIVVLTLLGGGAFGNARDWIHDAIRRAMVRVANFELDVRIVSYGQPSSSLIALARELA